jgi:hypothetical protein
MKKTILHLLAIAGFTTATAFSHSDVELGPNGGRVLEFSKDESMHGEVTEKGDKFHIAVLDKNMKPVKMDKQSLTATGGTREKPEKLAVEKGDKGFLIPLVKDGQWLIVQYKEAPETKAITARLQYDTKACGECKKPEWLCVCGTKKK